MSFVFRKPVVLQLHGGEFAIFYGKESGPLRQRFISWVFDRAAHVVVLSAKWDAGAARCAAVLAHDTAQVNRGRVLVGGRRGMIEVQKLLEGTAYVCRNRRYRHMPNQARHDSRFPRAIASGDAYDSF
jgi:hypothetical protein